MMKKRHLFLVLVLEGHVGLLESFIFSFFGINGWGIDLDYCGIEWFALEMNRDHSVIFEIAPECCILDPFVSSKGFLPIVLDIMDI